MATVCTEQYNYKYDVVSNDDIVMQTFDNMDDAIKFAKSEDNANHIVEVRVLTTVQTDSYITWLKSKAENKN